MKKSLKVTPIKGRPLLHWAGKKPPEQVRHFPAQLHEIVKVATPPEKLTYENFSQGNYNLLFHGDNREVISFLLVSKFRGKIDLIYIDPPFDSGANYVRKVSLRGQREKLAGETYATIEQAQYEDIWANDNYLQYMYERLILMRELLSNKGSICMHCDWHKSHHLRFLLDEVFGPENFINEIVWRYKKFASAEKRFLNNHDILLVYKKSEQHIFNPLREQLNEPGRRLARRVEGGRLVNVRDNNGDLVYFDVEDTAIDDCWDNIPTVMPASSRYAGFPTQKPDDLLKRVIEAYSDQNSIVLDCFCGSGTTASAAEELGRRWIAADINKGAVQTTSKRLRNMFEKNNGDLVANGRGFLQYKVNNYDFCNEVELKRIIVAKYGIQADRKDLFFDGVINEKLAKIVNLHKPLTLLDIQIIKDEIRDNRPDETRDIAVFCNGSELGILAELAKEKMPINKITVCDIQQDGMILSEPAVAKVKITRRGLRATVKIEDYISPTILARMNADRTFFDEQIGDFRAQIDYVLIDSDYKGNLFKVTMEDWPKTKKDFIKGEYRFSLPQAGAKVAVKIVDMLGEETLVEK